MTFELRAVLNHELMESQSLGTFPTLETAIDAANEAVDKNLDLFNHSPDLFINSADANTPVWTNF